MASQAVVFLSLFEKIKFYKWGLVLMFCVPPLWTAAQSDSTYTSALLVNIIGTEYRQLQSSINNQVYELYIALPDAYGSSDTLYPVLYLTDGNTQFGIASDITRSLQWVDQIPDMIVIGIGYPISQYEDEDERWNKWLAWRMRDLSPTNTKGSDDAFSVDGIKSGGGKEFLSVLRDEIIPFVESEYKARKDQRTYWGFSLGGLFGLYTMFEQPDLFENLIIGSASIWYDDKLIIKNENLYRETYDDMEVRLFMSVGELEEEITSGMVRNTLELGSLLKSRNYPGLQMKTEILGGEDHMTAPSRSLLQGLKFVYAK